MNKLKKIIWLLILAEILLAAYQVYLDYNDPNFCLFGTGCDVVKHSIYGSILGIKVSLIGLAAFTALLAIFIFMDYHPHIQTLFLTANVIGLVMAVYFLYIQFFVLKAVCSFCLFSDGLMLVIAPLSIIHHRNRNN